MIGHVAPQRECQFRQFQIQTILFAVANECAKLTGMHVIMQCQQETFVEFKGVIALQHQLIRAVQELCEHRWHFLRIGLNVAASFAEFMPESEPILFDETLETFDCAVEWIAHQGSQRANLRSAIPSVGAVNHHGHTVVDSCRYKTGIKNMGLAANLLVSFFGICSYSEVSNTALTCFSQPDDSRELRKPLMVNVFWSIDTAVVTKSNVR